MKNLLFGLIAIMFLVGIGMYLARNVIVPTEVGVIGKVTNAEILIDRENGERNQIVNFHPNGGVLDRYVVEDHMFHFTSAQVYAVLQQNGCFEVTTKGRRIGWLSQFKNIVAAEKIDDERCEN